MGVKDSLEKYDFSSETLLEGLPAWLSTPIFNWCRDTFYRNNLLNTKLKEAFGSSYTQFTDDFHSDLQLAFRTQINNSPSAFLTQALYNRDKLIKLLDFLLSKYGVIPVLVNPPLIVSEDEKKLGYRLGDKLESILAKGGSAYAARQVNSLAFHIEDRVADIVIRNSKKAIDEEQELNEAWSACYGQNPNYAIVVQKSQNVLEKVLRDNYLPGDNKAQLGKLVTDIENGKRLRFIGSKILDDSNMILQLIKHVSEYREMHTAGNGKKPDRDIAVFILHTTIYFWNLHDEDKGE